MLKLLIIFALFCSLVYSSPLTNTTICDSPYDYKHPNGSCLTQCPAPFVAQRERGSSFCDWPCPGRYVDSWNQSCTGICKPEYVRNEPGTELLYCDNPQPIRTKPCPNPLEYRYPNGSCFSSCSYPFTINRTTSNYFCNAGCYSYLNPLYGSCLRYCKDEFIRFEDGITYCDKTSNGCPRSDPNSDDDFRYLNGSCLPSCQYPFRSEWSYKSLLCVPDCNKDSYFNVWTERCITSCDDEYIRAANGIMYCDEPPKSNLANGCPLSSDFKYYNGSCLSDCAWPLVPEEKEGAHYCNLRCPGKYYNHWNRSCVDTCRPDLIRKEYGYKSCDLNPAHNPCPYDWFVFLDRSCSPTCPSPYSLSSKYSWFVCHNFPCPAGKYIYSNGSCIETCDSEGFAISVEKGTVYCRETDSAKIEIYLRYEIPLRDFNAGGYRAKFITLMAKLLDMSSSEIKIISLKEGSTIIESEVVLGTKSKANSINQKLTEAAESKTLDLEGVGVLNHKFSVVIPESQAENDDSDDDNSSSIAIAIGLSVGLAVCIVTLVVYVCYQKKQKFLKVREQIKDKVKTTKIEKNEEIHSFVQSRTENVSPQTMQPESDQLSPRIKIESDKKEEEQVRNEGPLSMDEITKNIDESL